MGDLVPGQWEYRETDVERVLKELLAEVEAAKAARVGTGRTITVDFVVWARSEDLAHRR